MVPDHLTIRLWKGISYADALQKSDTLMLSFFQRAQKSELKDFAVDLAGQIAKRYPPLLDSQPGKRPSVNRLTRITEDACIKAVEFRYAHKLGWFSRARLGNHFRWALAELGYTKEFVDFATEAVVVHISRKR